MKAVGEFVFKGLDRKDGGEFTNERGQLVKYNSKYVLKVDEVLEGSINERKLNISEDNKALIDKIKTLKANDKIKLECDILLYQNSAKVVPVAIV